MGLDEKISDQVTGFLLLLLIVLLLFSFKFLELPSDPDEVPCPDPLFVQVDGNVRNPGVYSFCSTPTVQNLVEKAGGLKERGAVLHPPTEWTISSGARVVFTSEGKDCGIIQSQMSPFHRLTLGIPLSLNKESEEGLAAVPGIGPSLAKAIVEERTRRGGFRDPEELKDIPGIGPKLYARIRSHLRV
jgi:competence protein ComEA